MMCNWNGVFFIAIPPTAQQPHRRECCYWIYSTMDYIVTYFRWICGMKLFPNDAMHASDILPTPSTSPNNQRKNNNNNKQTTNFLVTPNKWQKMCRVDIQPIESFTFLAKCYRQFTTQPKWNINGNLIHWNFKKVNKNSHRSEWETVKCLYSIHLFLVQIHPAPRYTAVLCESLVIAINGWWRQINRINTILMEIYLPICHGTNL